MTNISTMQMLEVEPKFILEVASGIRDPLTIAADYGYSEDQWLLLREFDPFVKAVDAKKAELTAGGYTFRMKAAVGAEDLLAEVYRKATMNDDVSFHTQLEALKFFARAAGLDSPPREEVDVGSKFSISINLGGGKTVEISAKMPENRPNIDEIEPYYTLIEDKEFDIPFDSSEMFEEYRA